MTVMKLLRVAPAARLTDEAVTAPAVTEEIMRAGNSGKPLTRPEVPYLVAAGAFLVVGALIGIALDDGTREYTPPDGVTIFALVYIVAQAIERALEPLSHFFGVTNKSENAPSGATQTVITKSQAVKARDKAMQLDDREEAAAKAAWWQEIADQIRRNTATLWAVASMIGMIFSGWLGLLLLHAVKAPNAPRWLDIIITGVIIGGGTKPLHDLISNIQAAKEKKQNPKEASGTSAS